MKNIIVSLQAVYVVLYNDLLGRYQTMQFGICMFSSCTEQTLRLPFSTCVTAKCINTVGAVFPCLCFPLQLLFTLWVKSWLDSKLEKKMFFERMQQLCEEIESCSAPDLMYGDHVHLLIVPVHRNQLQFTQRTLDSSQ